MDKDKLIENIDSLDDKASVVLKLGHKYSSGYLFYEADMSNDIQKEIISFYKEELLELLQKNEIVDFNPIGKEDETVEFICSNEVDGYNQMKINYDNAVALEDLGTKNFYVLDIVKDELNLKLFRRYSKNKTLSKGTLYKIFSNQLTRIKEDVFQIDNRVDFMIVNDTDIIIFDRYSFEIITNYKSNYIKNMNDALEIIKESELISNFEMFSNDCNSSIKIAKQFTKAMQNNSISLIINNKDKIRAAINEAALPIDFVNGQFIYEDKEHLSILIALLSDKYAKTLITERITDGDKIKD